MIFIILSFSLLLLVLLFLILPKYQELSRLNAKIEAKETELRYTKEHFLRLKNLSKKLEEYQTQLQKIDAALPSDSSLTLLSVINFIEKTASPNGVILKDINSTSIISPKATQFPQKGAKPVQSPSDVKELRIDFEVTGSYPALKNFLRTLEKSAKLIEVEKLSFSFEETEIFLFSLGIKTYSY
jgi:Tfp pilus assembly protein PilO